VLAEGDAPQSLLWGHCLGVVADDSAPTATDFALYLASDPAVTTRYFEQLSLPPTNVEILDSDLVQDDEYVGGWTNTVTATARANPFWVFAEGARMEAILAEAVQAVLVGDSSAQEALDVAAEDIADLME
jgi:multiple sugar transport system substrate-binding protein